MKTYKHIVTMIFIMSICSALLAGSIDYLTNQSVPFLRTLSRNAATDETDIIVYNPAGTTLMKDGTYVSFNWQGFTKDYAIKDLDSDTKYKSTYPSPFIPSVFALYKKDNLALFGAFTIPAGGGTLEYKDGLSMIPPVLSDPYFKGTSLYYGYTLGFAYQVDQTLSFSLASRFVNSKKEYEGHATHPQAGELNIDSEKTSTTGFAGILGVNLNFEKVNVGIKYEDQTTLKYKNKTNANDLQLPQFIDGDQEYRDLPALLSFGISANITEKFKLNYGLLYFFIYEAAKTNEAYAEYKDGIEHQIGGEYKISDKWLISVGYNNVVVGGNSRTYTDFEYQLDSHFIGAGFRYTHNEKMNINFALAKPFYTSSKGAGDLAEIEYSKDVNILGLSVEYKLF